MYGFLPKKLTVTPACIRRENVYEAAPRKVATKPKVVTFLDEPPKIRLIQRRHSCAENYRSYASTKYDCGPLALRSTDALPQRAEQQQQPQKLLPPPSHQLQQLPSHRWSSGCAGSSVCGHYWRRMLPPSPRLSSTWRPPPPGYHVAVRRAASFSASRGLNANRFAVDGRPLCGASLASVAPPAQPPQQHPLRAVEPVKRDVVAEASSNLNRAVSSSTSDLYVDSFALKRAQSRDLLSVASSTSSMSEATVYRKIGPCNYVSVCDRPCRKSFRSPESSFDDRIGNSPTVRFHFFCSPFPYFNRYWLMSSLFARLHRLDSNSIERVWFKLGRYRQCWRDNAHYYKNPIFTFLATYTFTRRASVPRKCIFSHYESREPRVELFRPQKVLFNQ